MADVNDIYKSNSDNIKAEDIGNNMWTLTIKSADVKEFDNGKERKIVLTFVEWDKNLPLNITNARSIASLYGHNSNAWIGRQIMLFTMMVDYQGKQTPGIRVRAPMQAQAQTPPQAMPLHPAPRPMGGLQPGQPAPMPGYAQNSPQRPLQPPQTYAQIDDGQRPFAPPPADLDSEIPF